MVVRRLQQASGLPSVIFLLLLLISIAGFVGVNHLVVRFHEQEKALGRRLYAQAESEQAAGRTEHAIPYLRAAISYTGDNPQYQLSLARALRDTGRTQEAESYLIRLWEGDPQDGPINLALGRLFAREKDMTRSIQYYHNAAYGLWPHDSPTNGLSVRLELTRILLQDNAVMQAESELISISFILPKNPELHLQVAELFLQARDFERALAEYENVLRVEPTNTEALPGAGNAAFQLRRYRDVENYLSRVSSSQAQPLLEVSRLILHLNPYDPAISSAERVRRIKKAFQHAGSRLEQCGEGDPVLEQGWKSAKPGVLRATHVNDELNAAMSLVFQIERQTQQCAPAASVDQALLLLADQQAPTQP